MYINDTSIIITPAKNGWVVQRYNRETVVQQTIVFNDIKELQEWLADFYLNENRIEDI